MIVRATALQLSRGTTNAIGGRTHTKVGSISNSTSRSSAELTLAATGPGDTVIVSEAVLFSQVYLDKRRPERMNDQDGGDRRGDHFTPVHAEDLRGKQHGLPVHPQAIWRLDLR